MIVKEIVKDQRIIQFVEFGQLEKGQSFKYCRNIFMKVDTFGGYSFGHNHEANNINAVNLTTGEWKFFTDDVLVTPVEVKIMVTNNKIIDQ